MAVIKKKGNKSLPPISTASLPDVIFMILFFFMVSTTMRDQELHVKYQVPEATEVQKLEKKSLVTSESRSAFGGNSTVLHPVFSSTMPSKPLRISASS